MNAHDKRMNWKAAKEVIPITSFLSLPAEEVVIGEADSIGMTVELSVHDERNNREAINKKERILF